MNWEENQEDIYNDTVDVSRERSLQKAMAIFLESQEKSQKVIERPAVDPWPGIRKILLTAAFTGLICGVLGFVGISPLYGLIPALILVIWNLPKISIWLIRN